MTFLKMLSNPFQNYRERFQMEREICGLWGILFEITKFTFTYLLFGKNKSDRTTKDYRMYFLILIFFLYLIPLTSCCSTFLEDFEFTLILVANVNFRLFQDCGIAANRNQFHLQDLLSIPMQRVLKYHVLLSVIFSLFHLKYSKIKE